MKSKNGLMKFFHESRYAGKLNNIAAHLDGLCPPSSLQASLTKRLIGRNEMNRSDLQYVVDSTAPLVP